MNPTMHFPAPVRNAYDLPRVPSHDAVGLVSHADKADALVGKDIAHGRKESGACRARRLAARPDLAYGIDIVFRDMKCMR